VTIGNGIVTIGDLAFYSCYSLGGIYFTGNAPVFGENEFYLPTTLYYLPGTARWDLVRYPTVLWNPQIQTNDAGFGVRDGLFGFDIVWTNGQTVVVEACTNLSNPVWIPLAVNNFTTNNNCHFSDPDSTNHPGRFHRLTNFTPYPVWSGGVTGDDADIEKCRLNTYDPATRISGADAFIHFFLANPSIGFLPWAEEAVEIALALDSSSPIVKRDSQLLLSYRGQFGP